MYRLTKLCVDIIWSMVDHWGDHLGVTASFECVNTTCQLGDHCGDHLGIAGGRCEKLWGSLGVAVRSCDDLMAF